MKISKFHISILMILLSISIIIPVILTLDHSDPTIKIFSDEDFEKYNFAGNGTEEVPFLIENLDLTSQEKQMVEIAIHIKNTSKHFIIRNCSLSNYKNAIYLNNIHDSIIQIVDNYVDVCQAGFYLRGLSNCSIQINENHIDESKTNSITLYQSETSTANITNNFIGKSGWDGILLLDKIVNPIIQGNEVTNSFFGIAVSDSNYSQIADNLLYNNEIGISIVSSSYSVISGNNANNNFIAGGTVYSSNYSKIHNNTFSNQPWLEAENTNMKIGLYIDRSFYADVMNNTCLRNRDTSLELRYVHLCNFSYNNFSFSTNGNGIYSRHSNNNTFWMNSLQENSQRGVWLIDSSFNDIYHNAFLDTENPIQQYAFEEFCMNNTWFNDILLEGNFWFRWNASNLFEISGQGSLDLFPLDSNPIG